MSEPMTVSEFDAFASERSKRRNAEKAKLRRGFMALLDAGGFFERLALCPVTLTGAAVTLCRQADDPDYRAEVHRIGLAEIAGYEAPEPQIRVQTLQVITSGEPDAAVAARLAAEGFRRNSRLGEPQVIHIGLGVLAQWKGVRSSTVSVMACDLPSGLPLLNAPMSTAADDAPADQTDPAASVSGDPVQEAAPDGSGIAAQAEKSGRPYIRATVERPSRPDGSIWRLHLATKAECAALMLSVVTQNGLVDPDTAIETLRRSLELGAIRSNSSAKLSDALASLLEDRAVCLVEGKFYQLPGQPVLPRARPQDDPMLRRLTALPSVEIAAAVIEELSERGSNNHDAVVVGAAARLGYSLKTPRTNKALSDRINEQVEQLLGEGTLVRAEDRLGLAAAAPDTDGEYTLHGSGEDDGDALSTPMSGGSDDDEVELGAAGARPARDRRLATAMGTSGSGNAKDRQAA